MTSIHKLTHHSFIIVILSLQVLQFSGGFKAIKNSGSRFDERFYVPSCDTIIKVDPGTQEATGFVSDYEYNVAATDSELIPINYISNDKLEDTSELDEGATGESLSNDDDGYHSYDESKDRDATTDQYPSVDGYHGPYSIKEPNFPDNLFDGDQLIYPRCTRWCSGFCSNRVIIKSAYDGCLQVTEALNDVIVEGVSICCCSPTFFPLS